MESEEPRILVRKQGNAWSLEAVGRATSCVFKGLSAEAPGVQVGFRLREGAPVQPDRLGVPWHDRAEGWVQANGAKLVMPARNFEVHGVAGRVEIPDFRPLAIAPGQHVSFQGGRFQKVTFGAGEVWAGFRDGRVVEVERGHAQALGGRVSVGAFAWDLKAPDAVLHVRLEDVQLAELVKFFKGFKGEADGKIRGEVAVRIQGKRITPLTGRLSLTPGTTARIRYAQQPGWLTSGRDPDSLQYEGLRRAEDALETLVVSELELVLSQPTTPDAPVATVRLAGLGEAKGVQVPVDLRVNVRGNLAEAISMAFR